MLIVPLQPLPRQTLQVQLGGQACNIEIAQNAYGLFFTLRVSDVLICGGVICENLNAIVRAAYTGFLGDFAFWDTAGNDDPIYTGLGSRFKLVYVEQAELDAAVA